MKTLITDRSGAFSVLKTLMLAALAAPLAYLLYRAAIHDLGPLPYKEALHRVGDWAVRFLVFALALTPFQRALNFPRLAIIRRMAGVGAFTYALLHFLLYIANSNFQLGLVASEIVLRIYLTIGFVALLGLSALAATSTDGMVKRLGLRWKQLHRLVYVIAFLALIHYFLQSKIDVSQAVIYTGLFVSLMIHRLVIRYRLALTPARLAGLAVVTSILTAAIEALWYGLATGVDPWRILMANAMVKFGLRPAVVVLLAGLGFAAAAWAWPRIRTLAASRQPRPA